MYKAKLEYKAIVIFTAFLFALAWSWLPWLVYNWIALVTGILPPAGLFGYYIATAAVAGGATAVIEDRNPQVLWRYTPKD